MLGEDLLDSCGWTIAEADPDNFGGKPENETSLMKIGVLRNDDVAVVAGIFPDYSVIGVSQTDEPHVS